MKTKNYKKLNIAFGFILMMGIVAAAGFYGYNSMSVELVETEQIVATSGYLTGMSDLNTSQANFNISNFVYWINVCNNTCVQEQIDSFPNNAKYAFKPTQYTWQGKHVPGAGAGAWGNIRITKENVTITAYGTTFLNVQDPSDDDEYTVYINSSKNVKWYGGRFIFEGETPASVGGGAIWTRNNDGLEVKDVDINGANTQFGNWGIYIQNVSNAQYKDSTIKNMKVEGITFDGADETPFPKNVYIDSIDISNSQNGITFNGGTGNYTNFNIENVVISNYTSGTCVDLDDDILSGTLKYFCVDDDEDYSSVNVGPEILSDSEVNTYKRVFYLDYNNNADDLSGYYTTLNKNNDTSYVAGKKGKALFFDGINATTEYDSTNLQYDIGIPFSFMFWVNMSAGDGTKRTIVQLNQYPQIFTESFDERLVLQFYNGSTSKFCLLKEGNGAVADTWTHIAFTYDGDDTLKGYQNGILKNTTDGVATLGSLDLFGTTLFLSRNTNDYEGSLDEFMIFNRSLEQSEIQDWYRLQQEYYESDAVSTYTGACANMTILAGRVVGCND